MVIVKILTGHEKGVLSLSWCKHDADLLLSCGKDNRALCWNPQTSEIIGEVRILEAFFLQIFMFISIICPLIHTIAPFRRQLGIPSRMVSSQS